MSPPARVGPLERAYLLLGHATRLPGKFWLPVGGEPIVVRALRALRSAGFTVGAVTVEPVEVPGLPTLRDRYDAGPLGGLATILSATEEPFLLVGADMPFLDPTSLRTLRREYDGRTLVPVSPRGEWEVLHSVYSGLDPARVGELVRRGAGLRDLVAEESKEGRVRFLPAASLDPVTFTDVDTPEDYERVRSTSTSGNARSDR
jgi:molybdopterin-guanine dinucleotide biosynthesis protein A